MKIIPAKIMMFRRRAESPTPAFPVRVGASEGAYLTAKLWSLNSSRWAYETNYLNAQHKVDSVNGVEISNAPRRGFRIVGAEQRAEGGRAWKVLTPDGDLVDMREDVFLPILLDRGLPKNCVIDAEFQWCQNGSQLRLEEVGSDQHRGYTPELEAPEKKKPARKKIKTLKKKDLVVGGLYETSWVGTLIYLGEVSWLGDNYIACANKGDSKFLYISKTCPLTNRFGLETYPEQVVQKYRDECSYISKFSGESIASRYEGKWYGHRAQNLPEGTGLIWK